MYSVLSKNKVALPIIVESKNVLVECIGLWDGTSLGSIALKWSKKQYNTVYTFRRKRGVCRIGEHAKWHQLALEIKKMDKLHKLEGNKHFGDV
jgi:hypothetical protein